MGKKLEGRVALITGAGGGIGRGIAMLFAREGSLVVVADRSGSGDETASQIKSEGGEATSIPVDLRDPDEVRSMVDKTLVAYEKIDILVNNAAVQYLHPLWELPEELFDDMLRTNLGGYFHCIRSVVPHMIRQGKGSIINISSNLAFRALGNFSGYSATKGGIVSMSRTLALECAPYGIRVNCICPGSTVTPILDPILAEYKNPQEVLEAAARLMPAGRLGLPEDVARMALYLASDDSAMVLGATLVIDGGASIQLPTLDPE